MTKGSKCLFQNLCRGFPVQHPRFSNCAGVS